MNERLVSRLLILLSALLLIAELVLVLLYGVRLDMLLLPVICYVGGVGMLMGFTYLKGKRPEVESVSMRRQRAMQDELVRKRLEGYEVDEEFLPGGHKKHSPVKPPAAQQPSSPSANPPVSAGRGVPDEDPFKDVEPYLRELAESFGGYSIMIQRVLSMDDVAYKRMLYSLGMEMMEREAFLAPLKSAMEKIVRKQGSSLRSSLDHEGMDSYIADVLAGRDSSPGQGGGTIDLGRDIPSGGSATPPSEFSHTPRSVLDQFKRSLKNL